MANEELNGIIRQLGEIGTLIEQFSEIASEMKNAMDGAVTGLKKERADIEDAVKGITSASNKWESKISSVSKDVNEISNKILSLNGSISNINKLMDERIQPIKDYSEVCSSIMDTLNPMTDKIDRLISIVEGTVPSSNIADRLDKIEHAFEVCEQRDKQMAEAINIILDAVTELGENPSFTENSEDAVLEQSE